jgi:hypothetical protein
VDEVWIADTETDDIRQLPELSTVTDFEWAIDATQLYIADDGAIKVYSVATNEIRELPMHILSRRLLPDARLDLAAQSGRDVQRLEPRRHLPLKRSRGAVVAPARGGRERPYRAPATASSRAYSELVAVMNSVLRSFPPNSTLAQVSLSRTVPRRLPSLS